VRTQLQLIIIIIIIIIIVIIIIIIIIIEKLKNISYLALNQKSIIFYRQFISGRRLGVRMYSFNINVSE